LGGLEKHNCFILSIVGNFRISIKFEAGFHNKKAEDINSSAVAGHLLPLL